MSKKIVTFGEIMLMKGKLGIIPHKVQHPAEIKRLFNKIKGKGGQQ